MDIREGDEDQGEQGDEDDPMVKRLGGQKRKAAEEEELVNPKGSKMATTEEKLDLILNKMVSMEQGQAEMNSKQDAMTENINNRMDGIEQGRRKKNRTRWQNGSTC